VLFSGREVQTKVLDLRLYMWETQQMGAHARATKPGIACQSSHACKRDTNTYSMDAIKVC